MKNNFSVVQVNSPFEDTAFFVRNIYKKNAFLLDCGKLGSLTNQEVLSIYDIFISHTHIDHFYGFDRILRGSLMAEKTIRIFGPPGIIKNVRGKLDSYTWNLIKSYAINFEVIELSETRLHKRAMFMAENGFEGIYSDINHDDIDLGEGFTFDFAFFKHRVTSVGYRIKEKPLISADGGLMEQSGFRPGKWVGLLKKMIEDGCSPAETIEVQTHDGTAVFSAAELGARFITKHYPQDITFITDIAPSYSNYLKAIEFAKGTKSLLIEGVFMKEDVLHAIDKQHLTLDLAKTIYSRSGAEKVRFFHFAPRYDRDRGPFLKRLYDGFDGEILEVETR
ncbi:MAG: ribonuclease Z [Deferribacterales bacterium]